MYVMRTVTVLTKTNMGKHNKKNCSYETAPFKSDEQRKGKTLILKNLN